MTASARKAVARALPLLVAALLCGCEKERAQPVAELPPKVRPTVTPFDSQFNGIVPLADGPAYVFMVEGPCRLFHLDAGNVEAVEGITSEKECGPLHPM